MRPVRLGLGLSEGRRVSTIVRPALSAKVIVAGKLILRVEFTAVEPCVGSLCEWLAQNGAVGQREARGVGGDRASGAGGGGGGRRWRDGGGGADGVREATAWDGAEVVTGRGTTGDDPGWQGGAGDDSTYS